MIRFPCPDCGKGLTAPDEGAGRTGRCGCGAVFDIPGGPSGDPDPEPYRPRRRKGAGTGRWAVLVGLLLLTIAGSVWLGVRWSRPRAVTVDPDAPEARVPVLLPGGADGPDWTYRELLEYLRSRGLPVKMRPCGRGQFYMFTDHDSEVAAWVLYVDDGIIVPTGFVCVRTGSARAARELAGRHERGTLAWGRYCFTGEDATLDLVRQALVGRGVVTDGTPDPSYEDVFARVRAGGWRSGCTRAEWAARTGGCWF